MGVNRFIFPSIFPRRSVLTSSFQQGTAPPPPKFSHSTCPHSFRVRQRNCASLHHQWERDRLEGPGSTPIGIRFAAEVTSPRTALPSHAASQGPPAPTYSLPSYRHAPAAGDPQLPEWVFSSRPGMPDILRGVCFASPVRFASLLVIAPSTFLLFLENGSCMYAFGEMSPESQATRRHRSKPPPLPFRIGSPPHLEPSQFKVLWEHLKMTHLTEASHAD